MFLSLAIELQYSTDLGHTWLPLVLPCYPRNPDCVRHYQGSTYYSDVYSRPRRAADNRVIVPLPGKFEFSIISYFALRTLN